MAKIAEYKQIGTEHVREVKVSVLSGDEEAADYTVKEIPVYGIVYREMTQEEIDGLEINEKEEFYKKMNEPLTSEKKLELLIESIPVLDKPENRPGYLWKPIYNATGNCFGWEEIIDPYYTKTEDGDFTRPIHFEPGMVVVNHLFYTDGDDIWECIKSGEAFDFNDRNFFDVIS